jgi:hypothetical protein
MSGFSSETSLESGRLNETRTEGRAVAQSDPSQPGASKLIIDTDWKSQAQAEKERLSAAEKAPVPTAPGAPGAPAPAGEAAKATLFTELVRMLATQALLYMGAFPDPETGRAVVALDMAKIHVDMLADLEAKTKGNLNETEARLLQRTVHELRMEFVETSKAVAKAVEEGRIAPAAAGSQGPAPSVLPPLSP